MAETAQIPFTTGHVGLNVASLPRSIDFYQQVFGFELKGRSDEPGRAYAFLGQGETLLLTLWQQSSGDTTRDRPGLHHLSFQVPSVEAVKAAAARVRAAGARIHHGGIVSHREGAASGGLFFEDPDGIRLEIFAADAPGAGTAPHGQAPTCGFF